MRYEYLGNTIEGVLLESGPMDVCSLANSPEVRAVSAYDIRVTVSEDGRFAYDDSGRVHLTKQSGET